jgi:hypothetical protein
MNVLLELEVSGKSVPTPANLSSSSIVRHLLMPFAGLPSSAWLFNRSIATLRETPDEGAVAVPEMTVIPSLKGVDEIVGVDNATSVTTLVISDKDVTGTDAGGGGKGRRGAA